MDRTPLEKLGYKIQNSVSPANMTPLQKLGYVNAFKEEDHPRGEDGKFGSGGGVGEKEKSGSNEKPRDIGEVGKLAESGDKNALNKIKEAAKKEGYPFYLGSKDDVSGFVEWSENKSLPTLSGSEKQISYAKNLREKGLPKLKKSLEDEREFLKKKEQAGRPTKGTQRQISEIESKIELIKKETSASKIIDALK
jgi:hypothetical protein